MSTATATATAADFIAARESFSASPYWDVNGYAIGYGNHYYEDGSSVTGDDDPISQSRAYQLLQFYTGQNAAAIAAQLTVPQNSNQLAALTSIRYNCGTITTTLLNLINSGADPGTVADQIQVTCTTAGGIPNSDLAERRILEAELYTTPPGSGTAVLLIAALALGLYALYTK